MPRFFISSTQNVKIYIETYLVDNVVQADILSIDKDGNELREKFDKAVSYVSGKHKFNMSFESFQNLLLYNNQSLSVDKIIERANKYNKTIIYYHGKDARNEQVWGLRCLDCGHECKKFARWFNECKGCDRLKKALTHEEFETISKKVHNDRYLYEDKYKNSETKLNIFCKKCKYYFSQNPSSHMRGVGCPKCNMSKGERALEAYFISRNINYIWHHKFDSLRHINLLEVDFYLPDRNQIVEYNGEPHYHLEYYIRKKIPNPEKAFEDCKTRDSRKHEWAKEQGIEIFAFPYWDFKEMEQILDEYFGFTNAATE